MKIFKSKKKNDNITADISIISKDNEINNSDVSNNIEKNKNVIKKVEPKVNKSKKEICRIIVATPSYFVIKKGTEVITVNKKNNYRRGQDILY